MRKLHWKSKLVLLKCNNNHKARFENRCKRSRNGLCGLNIVWMTVSPFIFRTTTLRNRKPIICSQGELQDKTAERSTRSAVFRMDGRLFFRMVARHSRLFRLFSGLSVISPLCHPAFFTKPNAVYTLYDGYVRIVDNVGHTHILTFLVDYSEVCFRAMETGASRSLVMKDCYCVVMITVLVSWRYLPL